MVSHLQHVVSLRAIKLAKQFLPGEVLCCIGEGAHRMVVVYIIVGDKAVYFPQVDEQAGASIGFSLSEYEKGVFAEGECCNDAVVVHQCQFYGQVVVHVDRAGQGPCIRSLVNNSLLIPMSRRCLAKMLLYSTRISSISAFSASLSRESFLMKLARKGYVA